MLVPAVITDSKGRAVRGLQKADVSLLSGARAIACDLFEFSEDAPVSFTILLDGSGSMGLAGKAQAARTALMTLLEKKKPGDDFSLHVFAEGAVHEKVPFTEDHGTISRAAAATVPFGKTAFFDALARMPEYSLKGKNGSRAIVLITDGIDNASALSRGGLAEMLEGVDVPVYPLVLRTPRPKPKRTDGKVPEDDLDIEILEEIAGVSGGRIAVAEEAGRLGEAVENILRDLRLQYLLGFTPTGFGPVKFWPLSIRLKKSGRAVRMRHGYRGTEPPWQGRDSRTWP